MIFLTEYKSMDTGNQTAGPRLYAYSWQDAQEALDTFIRLQMIPPYTVISGVLAEEWEMDYNYGED